MARKQKANPLDDLTMSAPATEPTAPQLPVEQPKEKRPWNYKGDDAPDKVKRKTYLISNEIIQRLEAMADDNEVGRNELVRHLLDYALTQVDKGKHKLPVVQRNTLG